MYGALSIMFEDGMPSTLNHHQPDSPEGMEMGGVDLRNNPDLCRKMSVECNINEDTPCLQYLCSMEQRIAQSTLKLASLYTSY